MTSLMECPSPAQVICQASDGMPTGERVMKKHFIRKITEKEGRNSFNKNHYTRHLELLSSSQNDV